MGRRFLRTGAPSAGDDGEGDVSALVGSDDAAADEDAGAAKLELDSSRAGLMVPSVRQTTTKTKHAQLLEQLRHFGRVVWKSVRIVLPQKQLERIANGARIDRHGAHTARNQNPAKKEKANCKSVFRLHRLWCVRRRGLLRGAAPRNAGKYSLNGASFNVGSQMAADSITSARNFGWTK